MIDQMNEARWRRREPTRSCGAASFGARSRHHEKDGGIHQIELLFDGERPVVLQHRGRRQGSEVVRAGGGEVDVDEKDRAQRASIAF